MIDNLNLKNQEMTFKNVFDPSFSAYGKILDSSLYTESFEFLKKTSIPEEGNFYIAHDQHFADYVLNKSAINDLFGNMPVQFGYVNGKNSTLNALEYHKSSEINIALTPLVLMLGKVSDIKDNSYHAQKLEMFYIPENTVFEIYASTLHFSPCKVSDSGFKCGVILPYGTNTEFISSINNSNKEDELLFKTNKWLISHPSNEVLIKKGAVGGILGTNYEVKF